MDRSKVFSLVLSVALLFAASFSFSQEKHSAFENGKIMFKFKENNALEIVSDNVMQLLLRKLMQRESIIITLHPKIVLEKSHLV